MEVRTLSAVLSPGAQHMEPDLLSSAALDAMDAATWGNAVSLRAVPV